MSTALVTLDLYEIHNDRHLLDRLHFLQVDRLLEDSLTGNDRPSGMRLSIADPVRRVKAAFDLFWALSIDEGVGKRGHVLEDYLQVALFDDADRIIDGRYYAHTMEAQAPIQWHEHGRSAFDWVVQVGADRPVSCKSSKNSSKPTSANVDQERRMMALAGYPAGSLFEIWVIDPSTFRAVGPYEYTLEQDHIDAARRELAGVSDAFKHFSAFEDPTREPEWNDPEWWAGLGLESNSGAFKVDRLDANGGIEARIAAFYRAMQQRKVAQAEYEAALALIKPRVLEQLALRGQETGTISAHGKPLDFSVRKNGALVPTERREDAAQNAA